ncbi:MAG: YdcF family protein [Elusimicrobia bacterium]|nr:YdcF family protein [Elusimicrobiota bacterium]
MRRTRLAALAVSVALVAPELAYWVGARACPAPVPSKGCGVLVLGFPARRNGSPHPMQRHRVATAVEVMRRAGCETMVLSGGNPHSPRVEAAVMADLAREAGVPGDRLILEGGSRDTWENIRESLRFVQGWEAIYLVSDGLHAHRAKRYLCRQRPGLCGRARPAARYRFGELYPLKLAGGLHEARLALLDSFR